MYHSFNEAKKDEESYTWRDLSRILGYTRIEENIIDHLTDMGKFSKVTRLYLWLENFRLKNGKLSQNQGIHGETVEIHGSLFTNPMTVA